MTQAQALSLIGGAMQAGALVWAWVVLYARWRQDNPGLPVMPSMARALRAVGGAGRRVWAWLSLPKRVQDVSGTIGDRVEITDSLVAVLTPGGTTDERLASLEQRFRLSEEHTSEEFRKVRTEADAKVVAITDEHRADRDADRATAARAARFNLGFPALLAILGTILQTWASFAIV